jgi:hypothetical protein
VSPRLLSPPAARGKRKTVDDPSFALLLLRTDAAFLELGRRASRAGTVRDPDGAFPVVARERQPTRKDPKPG